MPASFYNVDLSPPLPGQSLFNPPCSRYTIGSAQESFSSFPKQEAIGGQRSSRPWYERQPYGIAPNFAEFSSETPSLDPYKTLGLSKDATSENIKKAYRTLALRLHPDRCSDESKKVQRTKDFHEVQLAWDIVGDEEERLRYDAQVRLAGLRREAFELRSEGSVDVRMATYDVRTATHEDRRRRHGAQVGASLIPIDRIDLQDGGHEQLSSPFYQTSRSMYPPSDSGYASVLHHDVKPGRDTHLNNTIVLIEDTQTQARNDKTPRSTLDERSEIASTMEMAEWDDNRTIYSYGSSLLASEKINLISELADKLVSEMHPKSLDEQTLGSITELLPSLLRVFALGVGYNAESQKHRDVMVWVHKNRGKIAQAFKESYMQGQGATNLPPRDTSPVPWEERTSRWSIDSKYDHIPEQEIKDSVALDVGEVEEPNSKLNHQHVNGF